MKKFKILQGSWKAETLVGETDDPKEIWPIINNYIESIKFKSYYVRTILDSDTNTFIIDYGSHSNFINIVCDSKESYNEYMTFNIQSKDENGR